VHHRRLFANSGGSEFLRLQAITEDHFDRILATNVKGTLFTVQKALPLLRDGAFCTRRPLAHPKLVEQCLRLF
jgi:NAD(P)-dependent dehydrogenase (short-subunit alcohol dehydrogenase family)